MSLIDEIHQQPAVLERLLGSPDGEAPGGALDGLVKALERRPPRFVYLAARGTSDNAGLYAKYLFSILNGLPVALAAPSVFGLYGRPPALGDALVIGISQSGQSPDIVGVVEEGARQGATTLAITNTPGSPLASAADFVLDTRAGEEKSVAATKTYTTQLMAIAMLAVALSGDGDRRRELEKIPAQVASALDTDAAAGEAAARYRDMERCVVLGRGFHLATATEWALKLEELTYAVAQPYSPSDFHHGPIAMVEPGFPVLAVQVGGPTLEGGLELLRELKERRADLLVLSDLPRALELGRSALPLPAGVPEWASPIVAIVPAQLFCLHLAEAKGFDPETPRGLRKVTRTL